MGASRHAAVAAVTRVLLSVALVAAVTGSARGGAPLLRTPLAFHEPTAADGTLAARGERIPCDYEVTNVVVVDAPCRCTCGLGRQYRVNQQVDLWAPGTPHAQAPRYAYTLDWLCTPTRALAAAARSGKAGRHALTCLPMTAPSYKALCAHVPRAVGCGWQTTPRLTAAAAAALKAAVPPPPAQHITQCRREPATI